MFVLGAGIFRTGAINFVGALLKRIAARSFTAMVFMLLAAVTAMSAFLNNTAVVAVLIPVVIDLARKSKVSASKLLMPLSYASMFGGVCTLIGTSTNILGASIATQHGQPPFGMFEFGKLGLLFAGAGIAYMTFVGVRLVPARRSLDGLAERFGLGQYVTEVELLESSPSVGKKLRDSPLLQESAMEVIEIQRDGHHLGADPDLTLSAGDLMWIKGDIKQIAEVGERIGVQSCAGRLVNEGISRRDQRLAEAIIAPNSSLLGRSLQQTRFYQRFGAVVLAILHRGTVSRRRLRDTLMRGGDALLILARSDQIEQLRHRHDLLVVSEPQLPRFRRDRAIVAALIVAAVVAGAALGWVPIAVSAVAGALLMILSGAINPDEAYRAIEWQVLMLLAGLLALGVAMEKTGAARMIAHGLVGWVGGFGPRAILSALFLLTLVLTEMMSNNATVVLLIPIAIVTADSIGVSPRPFMFAVMFGASLSFMTPVGYQTNTMIYGPGQYRFTDFMRVGGPLNLLVWVIGSLLIPVLWPF
jgi:di/tricarboxylate transporter